MCVVYRYQYQWEPFTLNLEIDMFHDDDDYRKSTFSWSKKYFWYWLEQVGKKNIQTIRSKLERRVLKRIRVERKEFKQETHYMRLDISQYLFISPLFSRKHLPAVCFLWKPMRDNRKIFQETENILRNQIKFKKLN